MNSSINDTFPVQNLYKHICVYIYIYILATVQDLLSALPLLCNYRVLIYLFYIAVRDLKVLAYNYIATRSSQSSRSNKMDTFPHSILTKTRCTILTKLLMGIRQLNRIATKDYTCTGSRKITHCGGTPRGGKSNITLGYPSRGGGDNFL